MKKQPLTIDIATPQFIDYIYQYLEQKYDRKDIKGILNIFLEELEKDLINNQEFRIKNFGSLRLQKMIDHMSINFQTRIMVPIKGKYKLVFAFHKPLMKFLLSKVIIYPQKSKE